MGIVSQKLRDSARGQLCTLEIVGVCNHDPATVVLAHLQSEVKGAATKSDDWNACFACSACHTHLDEQWLPSGWASWYSLRALQRTQKIWRDAGLIVIAGDNPKPKPPSSKTIARRPMVQP